MPVDPDTYEKFILAEQRAKALGMSLMEVLDRAQLLLTVSRRHNLQVEALEDLYRRLDRQSPNKLLAFSYGRDTGTAGEMFEAMKTWILLVVTKFSDKTLEEL